MAYAPPPGGAVGLEIKPRPYTPPDGGAVGLVIGIEPSIGTAEGWLPLAGAVSARSGARAAVAARLSLSADVQAAQAGRNTVAAVLPLRAEVVARRVDRMVVAGMLPLSALVVAGPKQAASVRASLALSATVRVQHGALPTGPRRLAAGIQATWLVGAERNPTHRARSGTPIALDPERRAPWIRRSPLHDDTACIWSPSTPQDRERRALWSPFPIRRHLAGQLLPWLASKPRDQGQRAPWAPYPIRRHLQGLLAPWAKAVPQDRERHAPWGNSRAADGRELRAPVTAGRSADLEQWVPWVRFSRLLNPGWGVVTPPGPAPDEHGTYIVPVKRVYIMLNESSLVRLSDMRVIPAFSITMSLDVDSWAWNFSAALPADQLPYVEDPTEALQVVVNGELFVMLPERISRSREFGRSAISVQGRSRLALLDSPYAPVQSFTNTGARTAQQLIADVLSVNGVPMDTAVDFQLTDWLIQAGVFAHQGTYVSAINAIAAAAGGYVQAHATDDALSVLARYPTMPWEWSAATPHFQLPSSVTTRESIEWLDRPAYNRVFVSGTATGVLAQITRTGSAGDLEAPMVTDALVTHVDAARQRGMSVLGATGRAANVSLRLPVLEETGVITPGKFVRYVDGPTTRLGIVRSVGVDVAAPEAWQTIGVECYESV